MLVIDHVYKSFGNTLVLDNINMLVEKKTIVGLAGPSGSGSFIILSGRLSSALVNPSLRLNALSRFIIRSPACRASLLVISNPVTEL